LEVVDALDEISMPFLLVELETLDILASLHT
jgi:hypothetical protein